MHELYANATPCYRNNLTKHLGILRILGYCGMGVHKNHSAKCRLQCKCKKPLINVLSWAAVFNTTKYLNILYMISKITSSVIK